MQRILDEIAESELRQETLKRQEDELRQELLEATRQQSGIEARLESARETLETHDQDRRVRIAAMQSAVENGLVDQTFDDSDDSDDRDDRDDRDDDFREELASTAWAPTRAHAIAKAWRSRMSGVRDGDDAWQDAQNGLNVQFKTLEQALPPTGLSP